MQTESFPSMTSCLIALLIASFCPSNVTADVISLVPMTGEPTGASHNALAGPLFPSDLDSVTIPGSGSTSAMASKDGNIAEHISTVELDYSVTPAFFESDFSTGFSRTSILDHRASAESIFHFTVDSMAVYEAMGSFAVTDAVGTTIPGNVELEIELLAFDLADPFGSPPEVLLYSYQVSKSTLDAGFTVGGLAGDDTSILEGDVIGILDTDKLYRYRTLVTTNAIDIDDAGPALPTDGGAMASGGHTLIIGTPMSVPEPTSCLAISMLGLTLLGRRRKVS